MAKKAMVTRTITTLKVNALFYNKVDKLTFEQEHTVSAATKGDENKILKELAKLVPEDVKPVSVLTVEQVETLYGMDETTFINNATVLPPRKDYGKSDQVDAQ